MKIKLSAHIRNPRFNKDGSATLSFTTGQEILDDQVIYLLNAGRRDDLGWLIWSPNKIQLDDIPTAPATDESKTPAQRQRAVIYLQWKQQGQKGSFEEFYHKKMERVIDYLKSQLEQDV